MSSIKLRSGAWYVFGEEHFRGTADFVDDVIVPVSRVSRAGGHTLSAWAVAAHECVCATVAMDLGLGSRLVSGCLHHDDGEALVGDVMKPLKQLIPEYGRYEKAAHTAAASLRGAPVVYTDEEVALIKKIDDHAWYAEASLLKGFRQEEYEDDADDTFVTLATKATRRAIDAGRAWGTGAAEWYMKLMEKCG